MQREDKSHRKITFFKTIEKRRVVFYTGSGTINKRKESHTMKKRGWSILLLISLLLTVVPVQATEEVEVPETTKTLTVEEGQTILTQTGYRQGDQSETAYTGAYTITGSQTGNDAVILVDSGTQSND